MMSRESREFFGGPDVLWEGIFVDLSAGLPLLIFCRFLQVGFPLEKISTRVQ